MHNYELNPRVRLKQAWGVLPILSLSVLESPKSWFEFWKSRRTACQSMEDVSEVNGSVTSCQAGLGRFSKKFNNKILVQENAVTYIPKCQ
jgi:hypothetical protein